MFKAGRAVGVGVLAASAATASVVIMAVTTAAAC